MIKRFQTFSVFGGALCIAGMVAAVAHANTDLWITSSSGLYTVSTNWSAGVPGAGDGVVFDRTGGATYTVTFPGQSIVLGTKNYVSAGTSIGSNTVTFDQSPQIFLSASTYTTSALGIGGPPADPAVLNTTLLNLSCTVATIGLGSGSPGTLNVNAGTFTVSGSSSDYDLIVGNDGSGSTMNVTGGAQASLTGTEGNAVVGKSAGVTGTVNVSGAGSALSNDSNDATASLDIGDFGTGNLNITAGAQVNDYASEIAVAASSIGSAMVSGAGSTWTNRGTLVVGGRGLASLTISDGGVVSDNSSVIGSAPGSTGTVTVTGAGSKWNQTLNLRIGNTPVLGGGSSTGALHISAGGQVGTGGDADVGAAGNGTAAVDGSGSKWAIGGTLTVDEGSSLNVTTGALVTSGSAFDESTINVSGVGSTWTTSDYVYVGVNTGSPVSLQALNVSSGAHVNNRLGFVGADQGNVGQVVIDGANSTWSTAEQLFVGLTGEGRFFVTSGAHATSNTGQLGTSFGSIGTIVVADAGSTWTNTGDVNVGVAGSGNLTAADGGVVTVGGLLSVGPHGTIEGNSHVAGTVRNGGTVAPGLSTSALPSDALGTLHFDGDFTQTSSGTLGIQLASLSSFDKLAIVGHATLGGTLSESLFGGFAPAVGSAFQILTATNGITGTFTLDFSTLGTLHGPTWILVYSNSDVVLKLVNLPTGDYNRNGVVDAADYTVWRDTLGQTGFGLAADGDGNHAVDVADYDLWKSHFGETAGSGAGATAASAAVPEPSTVVMLIIAAASWCLRQRRVAEKVPATHQCVALVNNPPI